MGTTEYVSAAIAAETYSVENYDNNISRTSLIKPSCHQGCSALVTERLYLVFFDEAGSN